MVSVVVTTIIEDEVSIIKEMLGPYVDEFMIHDASNTLQKYSNEAGERKNSVLQEAPLSFFLSLPGHRLYLHKCM